ncbi:MULTISPECIES: spore coat protein U domain-containing protein [unclassified Variovorax]|uniref:spore coat protein U domain-containing protein n=1 Tax=unclassified Variovorax TaxID=663243 RepID=UPI003F453E13
MRNDASTHGALIWVAGLIGALAVTPAHATCTSTGLGTPTCSATISATALSFGSYSAATTSATTSTGTITVAATFSGSIFGTSTLSYTVSLSAGNSGTTTSRYMSYGNYTLNYNLYTSSTYGTVWATSTVSGSASASGGFGTRTASTTHTVYGRLPTGQYTAAPGSYTDTITVTVTY